MTKPNLLLSRRDSLRGLSITTAGLALTPGYIGELLAQNKGRKLWATQYNLKKEHVYSYETFDRIAENKDVDIVYIVTPPALHPEFTIRAAKAGKHVISEKPMATSVTDCDRMIAACKKAKVQLGIGYRMHYDLFRKELMRIAQAQEFGPFMKMSGNFSFVMNQHQWRIEKQLAGGGAMTAWDKPVRDH